MQNSIIFFPGTALYYLMLDAQQITLRFLDTRLQVHPDVVRYIQEQDNPELIDRIIAGVPEDTVVVSAKHIPGMNATRDGMRFLSDPSVEIVSGSRVHPEASTVPQTISTISATGTAGSAV